MVVWGRLLVLLYLVSKIFSVVVMSNNLVFIFFMFFYFVFNKLIDG